MTVIGPETTPRRLLLRSAPVLAVDVGTSNITRASLIDNQIVTHAEVNAFFSVPYRYLTEVALRRSETAYYRDGRELIVVGTDSEQLASGLNADTRRPMRAGLLNPDEPRAWPAMETLLKRLVPRAEQKNKLLAFTVPAPDEAAALPMIEHAATLRRFFEGLDYKASPINAGLAVILAELSEENYTGIGIACGSGRVSVTLAQLSVPLLSFSLPRGGDEIDAAVAAVLNEQATSVKLLKERRGESFDVPPRLDQALTVYYEDLAIAIVEALKRALTQVRSIPRFDRPLTIALAGGTASAHGFKELFVRALRARSLTIAIGEIRLAREPLTASAQGALIAAIDETR
ncbi:MAG: cell division FtsA domain-containing protein [Vicinamibacteria bacterium]|jgi:hypothetical protein|nr:cell division FtsA domain-containing protein [Vicinamibacteria bacterium]